MAKVWLAPTPHPKKKSGNKFNIKVGGGGDICDQHALCVKTRKL